MSCNNPFHLCSVRDGRGNYVPLPCGKCCGCKIDKRKLWEARLQYEFTHNSCAFVTFTYDDEHLRYKDGSVYPSVSRDDVHKYLDNIRHLVKNMAVLPSRCRKDYKYFLVSEYGDVGNRPHYHALFFGLDFHNFAKFFKQTWHYGMVDVKPLQSGAIRYVLKYLDKHQGKQKEICDAKGVDVPFRFSSHYLGNEVFYRQKDNIQKYGMLKFGQRLVPVPLYFKNKVVCYDADWFNRADKRYVASINRYRSLAKFYGYSNWKECELSFKLNKEKNLVSQSRLYGSPVIDTSGVIAVLNDYNLSRFTRGFDVVKTKTNIFSRC